MADIILTNTPTRYTPVLRVYGYSTIPSPSPHNNLERITTFKNRANEDINIPCFYGQILSAETTESIKGEISATITFPYLPDISHLADDTHKKELEVLYPKKGIGNTIPYFTISQLTPKYLYKLSYVKGLIQNKVEDYYNEVITLEDLDTYIDNNSTVSYWLYLSDYQIQQDSKQKTMSLIFTDIGYKLKTNWTYIFPTEDMFNWAMDNNTGNNLLSNC